MSYEQMSVWDYMKAREIPEITPARYMKPDDAICEGCKWRETEGRELEVDLKTGYTWVHKCPGTACANWRNGTPLNLTDEKPDHKEVVWYEEEDKPYCFNRDWLPPMDFIIPRLEEEFGIQFLYSEPEWNDGRPCYSFKFRGGAVMEITEDAYSGGADKGKRFVGVNFETKNEGFGAPCDNYWRVTRAVREAFKRSKKKKEKTNG